MRLLIAEDERELAKALKTIFEKHNYSVDTVFDGQAALDYALTENYDGAVLDVMMPKLDGFSLLSQLRSTGSDLPVLVLTAKEAQADKRRGLRLGADDYMTKPADEEELLLRIGALLRRAQAISSRQLAVGGTVLVYDDLAVRWNGRAAVLPRKEFQLLYKLLSSPGKTFTRRQLMDEIWDLDTDSDEHTVNVHINRLRDRFKDNRDFAIVTVRGLGYKAVRL